jgi:DinB superfamily
LNAGQRERLVLEPIADDPEIGRWLAALEDGRRDTLRELEGVTPAMIDWYPDAPLNSIGSLLYHVALIEADWVANEILELGDDVPELTPLLPWPDRDQAGHLTRVDGQSLAQHIDRLGGVRKFVLERMRSVGNDDFHRVRAFERYDVDANWALYHVMQHEAEHRSHIAWLRDTFPAQPEGSPHTR